MVCCISTGSTSLTKIEYFFSGTYCLAILYRKNSSISSMSIESYLATYLLTERWSLSQLGIDKKRMKIRNKSIFIDNKLYGQYQNSEFSQSQYNPPLLTSQDSQLNESRAPQPISANQMSKPPMRDHH